MNSSKAKLAATRGSTLKLRLLMNEIRGKSYGEAVAYLAFSPRRVSVRIQKLLEACKYNYEYQHGKVDDTRLIVKEAYCTKGPTLKRFRAKSMGRAGKILKRTANLNIELTAK